MANIKVNDIKSARTEVKVNDIKPVGAELFGDSESFINDLEDNELELTRGGDCPGNPFPSSHPGNCPTGTEVF